MFLAKLLLWYLSHTIRKSQCQENGMEDSIKMRFSNCCLWGNIEKLVVFKDLQANGSVPTENEQLL